MKQKKTLVKHSRMFDTSKTRLSILGVPAIKGNDGYKTWLKKHREELISRLVEIQPNKGLTDNTPSVPFYDSFARIILAALTCVSAHDADGIARNLSNSKDSLASSLSWQTTFSHPAWTADEFELLTAFWELLLTELKKLLENVKDDGKHLAILRSIYSNWQSLCDFSEVDAATGYSKYTIVGFIMDDLSDLSDIILSSIQPPSTTAEPDMLDKKSKFDKSKGKGSYVNLRFPEKGKVRMHIQNDQNGVHYRINNKTYFITHPEGIWFVDKLIDANLSGEQYVCEPRPPKGGAFRNYAFKSSTAKERKERDAREFYNAHIEVKLGPRSPNGTLVRLNPYGADRKRPPNANKNEKVGLIKPS